MKSVVYYGPKDVRVEDRDVPDCGAGEIRVKVDACAVCGTDMKSYLVGNPRLKAPIVMGHEFTGVIDTVGDGVTGFAAGERVVMATSISCGECYYCKKGWRNLCADVTPMGFGYDGGMAEYTVIPARAVVNGHVIKVPGDVPPEHAALAEPTSCAVNSIENCNVEKGDTVVVVGAGPMGILNACVARGSGAGKIILAEVMDARLAQADGFGFDKLVNSAKDDLAKVVADETGGIGADVVIVAAPAAPPQEQAPLLLRKRGTLCLFASLPKGKSDITLDSRPIHYGELRVVGTSDSTPAHVERAVEMIATGAIPAAKIATHILGLDDFLKSIELMQSGEALRVVLKP
jgi:L-iditol 2-dehydrogenase